MKLLIVLNRRPYNDGRPVDVTWNALRLAETSLAKGHEVKLFVMNEGVEIARNDLAVPEGAIDLVQMVRDQVEKGLEIKACTTCLKWHHVRDVCPEVTAAGMINLVNWMETADKVISF
ncbi:MAG: DsrE family protein [Chloroflexi bacterium]|nr:DsrE family protein [Chloroflexota bacterium]